MPAGETPVKIHPTLQARLDSGELLLTPNQRAARTLREAHPHPAQVLALETWLETLWHDLLLNGHDTRLLLNRTQGHSLWRRILNADPEVSGLRSPDLLAQMAAEAWATLCLYEGRARLRDFGPGTDARAFQRWAQEFERRCLRAGLVPAPQLPEALANALAQGTLALPQSGLTLVDCDDLPPAHATLFDQIQRAGYPVHRLSTSTSSAPVLHTAPDDAAELQAAAHWCRQRLDQDPTCRIAVVVPALADRRFALERAFAEFLAPEAQAVTAPSTPPLFELSLGVPLAQTAACAAALDLLRWTLHPLPVPAISALLLSPFFGAAGPDALAAADFDVHTLRRAPLLRPELSLEAFLDLAANPRRGPRLPPILAAHLRALRRAAPHHPTQQSPYETHAETFRTLLDAAGWTAATLRDPLTRQTRQRLDSVLDELATLDFDSPRPTPAEALRELTRLAQQTIFAPESTHAPVQVLGPLELGGLPFDHLWFLAADDLTWPLPPSPSPLIPWPIHQALRTPGADPALDRQRARTLTARITSSAPEVVVSYAQHSAEALRRPSPLFSDLPPAALPSPPPPAAPIPLLTHPDAQPILPLPDQVIEGGASILQAQAACPFRAFAEKRLRASAPETSEAGLNPRDRGTLVHDVMEHLWSRLEDQPTLLALTPPQRLAALDTAIDEALTRTAARARTPWERAYVELQRQRLRRLLEPWLDIEANRPAFAVREHEREAHGLTIGPLRLTTRIDRVDDTEAGPLILDYKTGNAHPSDWLTPRPEQPQLPLYAVLSTPAPAGVAFALLRPGEGLGLRGFSDGNTVFGKPSGTMQLPMAQQIDSWRQTLTQLAEDFAAGEAAVTPRSYPTTCQHCGQRTLCRLDLTTLTPTQTDDPEAEPALG